MNNYINRKNLYLLLLFISLVLSGLRLTSGINQPASYHIYQTATNFVGFIIGWEILLFLHNLLNKIYPKSSFFIARIFIQILVVSFFFTRGSLLIHYYGVQLFDYEISSWSSVYQANFLMAVVFNLILFGSHYFYRWQSDLVDKLSLEKRHAVVKYDALRNQLNPHFLFNALASLNSLIYENQQLSSDYLQQLSKVYRYILQNKNKECVSLITEISFLNHYIFLLKTRFEEAILIDLKINEVDFEKGIVPVLSQMLLENAVKHNIISIEYPLKVSISTDEDYFVMSNNLNRKTNVETSNNIGMQNIKDLYKYLTEKSIVVDETNDNYTVKIPLI